MHLKMKVVELSMKGLLKNEKHFDDVATMAKLRVQCGLDDRISNDPDKITSNDSSFERHSQFVAEYGISCGLNMVDVYDKLYPHLLDAVDSQESALKYMNDLLCYFGIQANMFYRPEAHGRRQEAGDKKGEDDLFIYCREGFIRYYFNLGFDVCEAEGDADAWLTLRRCMVLYCLAGSRSQTSKYAPSLIHDLVEELASSDRTRMRLKQHMVMNPGGGRGGGQFYDKWCETRVRAVKGVLRNTHGKLDELLLDKCISSMSAESTVVQLDMDSLLHGKSGKERSHDLMGDKVREMMEEEVSAADPFNRDRVKQHSFRDKPRGNVYAGLEESDVDRFVLRARESYEDMCI